MSCKHNDGSGCSLGLYGGRPSPGVCSICPSYDGPHRGVGDVVHAVARFTGASRVAKTLESMTGKPCGCAERRAALNAAAPFSDEASR